jgi:uncharacterized repeat protein (TIGR01451 family)
MQENVVKEQPQRKYSGIFVSILVALLMVFTIFQTIKAQEDKVLPADLSGSEKSVDTDAAMPGSVVHYSIVISNNGNLPALNVMMTDTLTTGLTYEANSALL